MAHSQKAFIGRSLLFTLLIQYSHANADSVIVEKSYEPTYKTRTAKKPGAPTAENPGDEMTTKSSRTTVLQSNDRPYLQTLCEVDFTDEEALAFTEHSLWADRVYVPWFQRCGTHYVDIRQKKYDHFHLGFADPDVEFCGDNEQYFPSRINEDGSCEFVDIPTEPRTYASTHWGDEWLRIRHYDGDSFLPFALERIRIVGNAPVRICYKKQQESDPGEWITTDNSHSDPGSWLCWNHIEPGYWDLSDWAWDIVEGRVTSVDGSSSFSIDDIRIGN